MKLVELLKLADAGYADGSVAAYFDPRTGKRKKNGGDTLAEFVVIELSETFDEDAPEDDQFDEAVRVMCNGVRDLERVIDMLSPDKLRECRSHWKEHGWSPG